MRLRFNRRAAAAGVVAAAAGLLSACGGQGGTGQAPSLARVPLAPGVKVVSQVRRCDSGAHAYCGLQLVLAGPGYSSSAALRMAELSLLKRSGWKSSRGDTDAERSAQSPHGDLRFVYATGFNDLESFDQGTIKRTAREARSLSRELFARTPTLSAMLLSGLS